MSHDPMDLIASVTGTWDVSKVPQSNGRVLWLSTLNISINTLFLKLLLTFFTSHDPMGSNISVTRDVTRVKSSVGVLDVD